MKFAITCSVALVAIFLSMESVAHDGMGVQVPNGGAYACALCHVGMDKETAA